MGVFTALALGLSYLESLIPTFLPIPGMRLGLSNLLTVVLLYRASLRSAATVLFLRILLSALLFGTPVSFLYSLAGAVFSFLFMVFFHRVLPMSIFGVSMVGGVFHNVGQILCACLLLGSQTVFYYLPFLLPAGLVFGFCIGFLAALLCKKLPELPGYGGKMS